MENSKYETLLKDLKKINKKLLTNGFFDKFTFDENLKIEDESEIIIKWKTCKDRKDKILKYNEVLGIKFYVSMCRLGRNLNFCNSFTCNRNECTQNQYSCSLCSITKNYKFSPCLEFRKIYGLKINGLLIIPNVFPYLNNQFLIISKDHLTQTILDQDVRLLIKIIKIADKLCVSWIKQENGVIFFNGLCGNSIEHFHAQITTTSFPIFDQNIMSNMKKINNNIGLIDEIYYRGLVFNYDNMKDLIINLSKIIKKIIKKKFLYNFIIRRNINLEVILFIRNCYVPKDIIDLNYGSSELSGIVITISKVIKKEDILKYINATHNISNYLNVLGKKNFPKVIR